MAPLKACARPPTERRPRGLEAPMLPKMTLGVAPAHIPRVASRTLDVSIPEMTPVETEGRCGSRWPRDGAASPFTPLFVGFEKGIAKLGREEPSVQRSHVLLKLGEVVG
jgi:hypothetical protein